MSQKNARRAWSQALGEDPVELFTGREGVLNGGERATLTVDFETADNRTVLVELLVAATPGALPVVVATASLSASGVVSLPATACGYEVSARAKSTDPCTPAFGWRVEGPAS